MTGIKTKVEVEVEVPRDWLELRVCARSYCGYFLREVEVSEDGYSWLAWEFDEMPSNPRTNEPHADAIAAFYEGKPLPKHYHRIDENFMVKAFVEGVKLYGVGWYDDSRTDANTYDRVIQMALFGEQKYA